MNASRTWILILILTSVAAAHAQRPHYEVHVLEALETPVGVLDQVRATDLNDRGQVVGRIHNGGGRDSFKSAAFVFTPGRGMRDLDPDGAYLSRAEAINDRGEVFGRLGPTTSVSQTGLFIFRPHGHEILEGPGHLLRRFWFRDMNNAGEVVGAAFSKRRNAFVPFLYSPTDGWINLLPLDPRLAIGHTLADLINDHGEIVFIGNYLSFGADRLYVFQRDGSVVDLGANGAVEVGQFGADNYNFWPFHTRRFSKTGEVVGVRVAEKVSEGLKEIRRYHAAVHRPGKGLVDIHPRGFKASGSNWIGARGLIGGTLQDGRSRDTLFTYDEHREPKLRVEVTADEFRALQGGDYRNVIVFDMSDHGDFIGAVNGRPTTWFFHSRDTGLVNLHDLLAASGGEDFDLLVARRVNDRGQILLLTRPRGSRWAGNELKFDSSQRRPTRTLLLTPVREAP